MNTLAYVYLYVKSMFSSDEDGQGMAEYGLILALVSVVVIAALTTLGTGLKAIFASVTGDLNW